jgi:hypothetical protein
MGSAVTRASAVLGLRKTEISLLLGQLHPWLALGGTGPSGLWDCKALPAMHPPKEAVAPRGPLVMMATLCCPCSWTGEAKEAGGEVGLGTQQSPGVEYLGLCYLWWQPCFSFWGTFGEGGCCSAPTCGAGWRVGLPPGSGAVLSQSSGTQQGRGQCAFGSGQDPCRERQR